MLKLRRGRIVGDDPLEVEVGEERRRAWADTGLVGPCEVGDEVVVNVAALDLRLGSGGFDVVHVNLTRGLEADAGVAGAHVMKLNYTSLQHPVDPVEAPADSPARPGRLIPVLVLPLHGHLAPACWAFAAAGPGLRVGFVQVPGGALPGSFSVDVAALRESGLIAGQVTVAPCYGGEHEAISTPGALHAAADSEALRWDAAIVGPGPGILGSATRYGHGGMAALSAAHAALALGLPTLLSPRLSAADPRPRHRGLSHHTRAVLELLLEPVEIAVPEREDGLRAALDADLGRIRAAGGATHRVTLCPIDLEGYAESGLSRRTMGRDLEEDRLFFAAPLAGGAALAAAAGSE